MIKFFVEGHPETAHRPRLGRKGVYMDPKYQAWRELIGYTALQHVDEMVNGPIIVCLHFVTKSFDRQDIDNLAKAPLEALEGILYLNDRQVVNLHLFKSQPESVEGVLVLAWEPLEFAREYEQALFAMFELIEHEGVKA